MKIVFIGDVQLDDRNPRHRSDDYCVSVIKKIDFIFNWCCKNNVDKIVFLGDFFNRREVGGRARNLAIKVFKKYPHLPECLITLGNHDTSNDLHSIKQSSIWTLIQTNLLKFTDYDQDSKIAFCHHHVHVDKEILDHGFNHPDALIWSVHASLYYTQYQYLLNFDDIDITGKAKLFVTGHVHSAYEHKRKDGIVLINPGHIGRNIFDEIVSEHKIKFLVVEHDGENINSTQYINVDVALPYNEVFDLEKIAMQAGIKKKVNNIIHKDADLDISSYNMEAIINYAKKKLPKSTVDLIIQYLGHADNDRAKTEV